VMSGDTCRPGTGGSLGPTSGNVPLHPETTAASVAISDDRMR
jgi:hypothetical protein